MIRQWSCVLWIAGVACSSVKTDDTAAGGAVVDPTDDTGASVVDTGCDDPVDLYYDADGDGYGDDALMVSTCDAPAGHVTQGGDCDDIDPEVNPGAEEQCNEQDDNCNEEVDEGLSPTSWYADLDGDGYGDPSDVLSSCDVIAERVEDSSDCDDSDSWVHPGAEEVCNSQDDDCDSEIDEDVELYRYYADSDGDGYGDPETFLDSCSKPDDFVTDNTDCNDTDVSAFPGGIEVLDGVDNDCNGVIDDLKVYDADIRINGEIGASGFGYVLSGGSDMTDDGTPDLLIGSNSANSAVIVSGDLAAGEYDHDESIVQIFGVDSGSMFGSAVTMLDDFNGDGHPDVAIAGPGIGANGELPACCGFLALP
ncbi:MAG: hypothetical protein CL930_03575 [Deltaproteobacteria bacterium]|nr:hypothetical protein [Deltaproteobacteria bacterium]